MGHIPQSRKSISKLSYVRYSDVMPRGFKPAPGALSLGVASALRAEMGRQDNMSKAELARRAGLDRTAVSDIVRGLSQADIEQLDALCQALGISMTAVIEEAEAATDSRRLA